MRGSILTGQIRPQQIFLSPAGEGGGGGGSGSGSGDDAIEIPEEFQVDLGIDEDLLDDDTKAKFNQGKLALQRLQKLLVEKSKGGDQAALQNEINQLRQQLQGQQQQQQQKGEPTLEDKMRAHYKSVGVPDANIEGMMKLNAPLFQLMGEMTANHVAQVTAPLNARIQEQAVSAAFDEVTGSDPRFAIPEVAQAIWEKANSMAQKGIDVDAKLLLNTARIVYMEKMDDPKFAEKHASLLPSGTPTPSFMRPTNVTSRFTYPGAGAVNVPLKSNGRGNGIDELDPDTRAAVEATKKAMKSWTSPGIPKAPTK